MLYHDKFVIQSLEVNEERTMQLALNERIYMGYDAGTIM